MSLDLAVPQELLVRQLQAREPRGLEAILDEHPDLTREPLPGGLLPERLDAQQRAGIGPDDRRWVNQAGVIEQLERP